MTGFVQWHDFARKWQGPHCRPQTQKQKKNTKKKHAKQRQEKKVTGSRWMKYFIAMPCQCTTTPVLIRTQRICSHRDRVCVYFICTDSYCWWLVDSTLACNLTVCVLFVNLYRPKQGHWANERIRYIVHRTRMMTSNQQQRKKKLHLPWHMQPAVAAATQRYTPEWEIGRFFDSDFICTPPLATPQCISVFIYKCMCNVHMNSIHSHVLHYGHV